MSKLRCLLEPPLQSPPSYRLTARYVKNLRYVTCVYHSPVILHLVFTSMFWHLTYLLKKRNKHPTQATKCLEFLRYLYLYYTVLHFSAIFNNAKPHLVARSAKALAIPRSPLTCPRNSWDVFVEIRILKKFATRSSYSGCANFKQLSPFQDGISSRRPKNCLGQNNGELV